MAQLKLALWDPAKDHGGNGGQESHHGGLDLGVQTNKQKSLTCPYRVLMGNAVWSSEAFRCSELGVPFIPTVLAWLRK